MFYEELKPILTVDVILFTVQDGELCVALQRRDKPPYEGQLALIGGYVHTDEDANTLGTAERVLREKAGLERIFLGQLMTFSGPARDPRGWSASVAYYALVPATELAPVLERDISLMPVGNIASRCLSDRDQQNIASRCLSDRDQQKTLLPFDHEIIIATAVQRLRSKGAYSSLPAFLLPPAFTMPQLREIYEKVMGAELNDSAFRRKIEELQLVEPVAGEFSKVSARPAKLYRLRSTVLREFDKKL